MMKWKHQLLFTPLALHHLTPSASGARI
jgi:hypothetical protein